MNREREVPIKRGDFVRIKLPVHEARGTRVKRGSVGKVLGNPVDGIYKVLFTAQNDRGSATFNVHIYVDKSEVEVVNG